MKYKSYMFIFSFFCLLTLFSVIVYADVGYLSLNLNYDGKTHYYNQQKIILEINGKKLQNSVMPPIIFDDYTVVPAREVFEEVGSKVSWNKDTYEVTVDYNDKKVVIKIGSKNATVNGVSKTMSIPAKIINNKTMIPLRFVSESVGLDVGWDSKTRVASINGGNSNSQKVTENIINFSNIISVTVPNDYSGEKFVINSDKVISDMKPTLLTENGRRLVVDIYDAKIKTSSNDISVSNFAVSKVRMGQNDSVGRVVFDLNGEYKYKVNLSSDKKSIAVDFENDGTIVNNTINNNTVNNLENHNNSLNNNENNKNDELSNNNENNKNDELLSNTNSNTVVNPPANSGDSSNIINSSYEGMYYDNYSTSLVIKKNGTQVDLKNVQHIDNYNDGVYKIIFNGDYTSFVKNAYVNVNDHNFSTIQVAVNSELMTVTFNEKKVLAFDISEDSENIYISALKPQSKYKNIVILDAGHGGHDSGATGGSSNEKSMTLDIVKRVLSLLEKDNSIKAYATRTTDVFIPLLDRSAFGNDIGDLFISVHINSGPEKANGTEVYYYDGIDLSLPRGISSSMLASTLQKNLVAKLGSVDRNVKREDFSVVRESTIPSSLCEIGFISNSAERSKLDSPEYRQLAAEAIYQSIKELFEKYPNR